MIIRSAKFICSSQRLSQCPVNDLPEFAFTGRSNVGKSSIINLLTGNSKLAKTSSTPGKTRTINHFLINDNWYLVDLPGYGYARTSAVLRNEWIGEIWRYVTERSSLVCLFVLIDSRIKPQKSDLAFMESLGKGQIPFARVFTKSDKLKESELKRSLEYYDSLMMEIWEELPATFITSARKKTGRESLLEFIEQSVNIYKKNS